MAQVGRGERHRFVGPAHVAEGANTHGRGGAISEDQVGPLRVVRTSNAPPFVSGKGDRLPGEHQEAPMTRLAGNSLGGRWQSAVNSGLRSGPLMPFERHGHGAQHKLYFLS